MLESLANNWTMFASGAVVIVAIVLYMMDRLSMEFISIGVIALLLLIFELPGSTGIDGEPLSADLLLAGFGNPALITIMALLVVGQGLFQTGALDGPSKALIGYYDVRPKLTLLLTFGVVFVTSAFINNTPVVIMFLPIMSAFAVRMEISSSKLMQPLSFVSVLAGMTTLIGTSTNLLAADAYRKATGDTLGFFELTPMGLILAAAGFVYIGVFARWLLPSRAGLEADLVGRSGRQFVAQIGVHAGNPIIGETAVAGMFPSLPNMTVRMVQRGERAFLPPFEEVTLSPGDYIIVAATRKALTETLAGQPDLLKQLWQSEHDMTEENGSTPRLVLVEAVVAPGSRMIGRAIEQLGFRRLTNTLVLGIQRRSRMIRARLGEIRLEAGDTLLLCGPSESFRDLRTSRDVLLLEWSQIELPATDKSTVGAGYKSHGGGVGSDRPLADPSCGGCRSCCNDRARMPQHPASQPLARPADLHVDCRCYRHGGCA